MTSSDPSTPVPNDVGLGRLLLVRHGQARVDAGLTEGYDRLSDLGRRQAELVARHWLEAGLEAERVFVGPLRRQQETAEAAARVFAENGRPWPRAQELAELEEHRGTQAFAEVLPRLAAREDELGEMAQRLLDSGGRMGALYLKVYRRAVRLWAREALPEADRSHESWRAFRRRIERGVERMVDGVAIGRVVVAFTSGGPVAAAAASTLRLGDEATLELSWVVQNCSTTELLFSPSRVTLKSFNDHSVLAASGMATFI